VLRHAHILFFSEFTEESSLRRFHQPRNTLWQGTSYNISAFAHTNAQAPRGLSAEEKRVKLLEIFHETVGTFAFDPWQAIIYSHIVARLLPGISAIWPEVSPNPYHIS
jgi:hypothetical protein